MVEDGMTRRKIWTCSYGLAGVLALVLHGSCSLSREIDLEDPLTAEVQSGIQDGQGSFDHGVFDALLRSHVRESGRVDYAGLVRDREKLRSVLEGMAAAEVETLSRDELLAFFINAYNAYTLDLIAEHYPVASIKDIGSPWTTSRCEVGGYTVSLNDIEHRILRPIELFDDPRMHFAINCASVGCPLLRPEAYVGSRIDDQLESSVKSCLRDSRYVALGSGEVEVSRILSWFKEDFVEKHGSLSRFLIPYVTDEVAAVLQESGDDAIGFLGYDWSLNDTANSP